MISVLASIRPFWCEKILLRMKSVELRKTYPRAACGLPFKVYMYETKPGPVPWLGNLSAGSSNAPPAGRIK